jgi:hypothetical protein
MQTGMSETDLKAEPDAFFERKPYWKTNGRTLECVYAHSERKCPTLKWKFCPAKIRNLS